MAYADEGEDDIYEGFGSPLRGGELGGGGPLAMPSMAPVSGQPMGPLRVPQSRGGPPPGTSRAGGGAGGEDARPMTAVRAAGYSAAGRRPGSGSALEPGGLASRGPAPPLQKRSDNSPEEQCRELEREVNGLIEASAQLSLEGRAGEALERAKEAGRRERRLCQRREEAGLSDQINLDLTYSCLFNLAHALHANRRHAEALKTYAEIVRNKDYHQSGRLRVNMGNIYFEQRKFPTAIKMYRMALDQVPNTGRELRARIIRNIGVAFVRLGQFQDAIASFEQIMDASTDVQAGFNLFLCYYALGEAEKMRGTFVRLLAIRAHGAEPEGEDALELGAEDVLGDDGLSEEVRAKQRAIAKHLAVAAKLLAPAIEADVGAGYDWAASQLRGAGYSSLANELEIGKALHFMRSRQFERAVETLKSYEHKDPQLVARAATNLSFIQFHEGDHAASLRYADIAMRHNRYNAKALVNKGAVLFHRGEFELSRRMFGESMRADADCIEAIYNSALASKRLGDFADALPLLDKLHALLPSSIEVLWQIADLHEQAGDARAAAKWFATLSARVPTDPGVLSRLGNLFLAQDDEAQAFHYQLESYRAYPASMDVIAWLGAHYVKDELYEQAVSFFERAAQIQPAEVKWRLMVASCHRRSNDYQLAYATYLQIHKQHPHNVECTRVARAAPEGAPGRLHSRLGSHAPRAAAAARSGLRYLVHLSDDLGHKDQMLEFVGRLRKAEKAHEESTLADGAGTLAQVRAAPRRASAPAARALGAYGAVGRACSPRALAVAPPRAAQGAFGGQNENVARNGSAAHYAQQQQAVAGLHAQAQRAPPGPGEAGYVESDYHLAQIEAASAVRARGAALRSGPRASPTRRAPVRRSRSRHTECPSRHSLRPTPMRAARRPQGANGPQGKKVAAEAKGRAAGDEWDDAGDDLLPM